MPPTDPASSTDDAKTEWLETYRLLAINLGAGAFSKAKHAAAHQADDAGPIDVSRVRKHTRNTAEALNAYNALSGDLSDGASLLKNEAALLALLRAAREDLSTVEKSAEKRAALQQVIDDAETELEILQTAWEENFDCEKPSHGAIEPEGGWDFAHGKKTRTGKMKRAAEAFNALGESASLEQQHELLHTVVQNGSEWLLDAKHSDSSRRELVLAVLADTVPKYQAVAAVALKVKGEAETPAEPTDRSGLTAEALQPLVDKGQCASFALSLASLLRAVSRDTEETEAQASEAEGGRFEALASPTTLGELLESLKEFCTGVGNVFFLGKAVTKLHDAWKHRKAYKETMLSAPEGEMKEVARYAFFKVKRRFALRLKDFAFSVVKTAMHVLSIASGGAVAIFSEALSAALTTVNVCIKLGSAVKKLIKWATGRLGANRQANAGRIVSALRAEWQSLMTGDILDPAAANVDWSSEGAQAYRMVTALGIEPQKHLQGTTLNTETLTKALAKTMAST